VFPSIDVGTLVAVLSGVLSLALAGGGVYIVAGRRRRGPVAAAPAVNRSEWRVPPLAVLERPVWSRGRTVGMCALRG